MAKKTTRRPRNSDIARALASDSELLRQSEQWVRERIYGLSNDEVRWLVTQYVAAYKEMLNAVAANYDGDRLLLTQRARLLAQIEREVDALMETLAGHIDQAVLDAFKQGYYGRAWILDTLTPADWAIGMAVMLPREAIHAMLLQDYIGTADWIDLERTQLVSGIKRSLTQSLIQGEGMATAAARLRKELGLKSGQTKAFKGSAYRTLLITRTEIMRASNVGALAIYERNQDVLRGWEFCATRDSRTCPTCGALDGKTFTFDSPQLQPPSGTHPGCRCTVLPWLRAEFHDPELSKPRELYSQWAARVGLADDGGLATQRRSDTGPINRTSAA